MTWWRITYEKGNRKRSARIWYKHYIVNNFKSVHHIPLWITVIYFKYKEYLAIKVFENTFTQLLEINLIVLH